MRHIMLDLETMGTAPGSAIIAIGAVRFDPRLGEMEPVGFYHTVKWKTEEDRFGLVIDECTRRWWEGQTPEACKVLDDPRALPLPVVLSKFAAYVKAEENSLIWGNGADFDQPILAAAYRAINYVVPWKPYNGRCYRTIKNLVAARSIPVERQGTHHNALDDARTQAKHLMDIIQGTTLTLE